MSDGLSVDIRAEQLMARLTGVEGKLDAEMLRITTRLSIEVQSAVKDKLTGPVLHVRTGTLRRSINRKVEQIAGSTSATIGTNVVYAGVHEFGFDGPVEVRAHTRQMPTGGVANVRAHARQMHVKESSYLRSTLREFQPRIVRELREGAIKALLP